MYENTLINGLSLPQGTVCLTFDDGPGETAAPGAGPRTVELARYLSDQGVFATFFMVGKFASDLPEALREVESRGHLVANHTYDHPNMAQFHALGGDVVGQVSRTDGLIRNWIDSPVVFFRPPYGSWDAGVASTLNANMTASLSHVGPIGWDIDGGDWACWRDGRDPATCLGDYLAAVDRAGRGIILMHDCTADMEVVKNGNRTLELAQLLVPELRRRGYNFARLDQVPDVAANVRTTIRCALKGSNGLYVSPQGGGGGKILVNGPAVGPWEPLVIHDLYVGKVAIQAASGHFISPQGGGGGDVLANGPAIGPWEPLDLISFGHLQVAFRTVTGHFLTYDAGSGALTAAPWLSLQPESLFTYEVLP
jgi:peptidoglycan/xylan/chitin deacetylase (PgdA/CDA1 family)